MSVKSHRHKGWQDRTTRQACDVSLTWYVRDPQQGEQEEGHLQLVADLKKKNNKKWS